MPEIPSSRLAIERTGSSARVTIDLDIAWDTFERRAGQEYLLLAEMWGEDGPAWLDPDNRLFTIGRPFVTDGTALQHLNVVTLVPVRDLNEDAGEDEIYARLRLTPVRAFGSASARSNTVRGNFNP